MRHLNRRLVLGAIAALPLVSVRGARARSGLPTVGYLSGGEKGSDLDGLYRASIFKGLAEQGFVIPDKLRWLERYAGAIPERPRMVTALEMLARELVAEGVEVIIANGGSTAPALAAAGPVPVVYGFSGDPIAAGIADSLARPRGNATGVTLMWPEANAKRIEILKELAPGVRHIALISSPNHPGEPAEIEVCRRSVASLGIEMTYMPVYNDADIQKALAKAASEEADALVSPPDPVTLRNRQLLAKTAMERRIPFVSGWGLVADSGALMTYGPSVTWGYQRVGYVAGRVLAGAKPADLPIEQPSRFELVLNLVTAKAIGLKISDAMIERADRVIE
jgi:putative tryptophan/tyrosine transport system substrate-binding protein